MLNRRGLLNALLASPLLAFLPKRKRLIDPKPFEHDFDPQVGDMGRGLKVNSLGDVDLSDYQPLASLWRGANRQTILLGDDCLPTGWVWHGFVPKDGTPNRIVAFETRTLKDPPYGLLNERCDWRRPNKMVRDILAERGIDPQEWLRSVLS